MSQSRCRIGVPVNALHIGRVQVTKLAFEKYLRAPGRSLVERPGAIHGAGAIYLIPAGGLRSIGPHQVP
jgi:hypothetical protein